MDIAVIQDLAILLRDNDISEISVEEGGSRIRLRKGAVPLTGVAPVASPEHDLAPPSMVIPASITATAVPKPSEAQNYIVSRIVGLFHPANPAVRPGDHVRKGQVVGAVESLKLMNDVVADVDGTVVEAYVEEGTPVEYGFRLFRIAGSEEIEPV
ncbi:MAG: acetyl-CoA carboxylase biotin carboxyl carrier protein [Capsulimonadaceae bacterium]